MIQNYDNFIHVVDDPKYPIRLRTFNQVGALNIEAKLTLDDAKKLYQELGEALQQYEERNEKIA